MICPKCGTTVNDRAVICVNCGNMLNNKISVKNNKSCFKIASFVLGILALTSAVITTIITLFLINNMTFLLFLMNFSLKIVNISARFIFAYIYLFLPLIMSNCGIVFAILSKNTYTKTELILNITALSLCIVQIIMIMFI